MGGDARQLHKEHARDLGSLRHFDPRQALACQRVGDVVHQRLDVVQPVGVREELVPTEALAGLLFPAVQVADHGLDLLHGFAVERDHQAQHAVGGRVLRTHVHLHRLAAHGIVRIAAGREAALVLEDLCRRHAGLPSARRARSQSR